MISIVRPAQFETREKVSSVVTNLLKKYIKDNDLKENDRLPSEPELERLLSVSRASIREAMKTLESSGIIYSVQGKGRFINAFSMENIVDAVSLGINIHFKDFQEIVQVRKALEGYYLPKVVSSFTSKDCDELDSIIDQMQKRIDEGASYKEVTVMHTLFHKRLYEGLDNKLFDNLISLFASMQRAIVAGDQDNESFIKEHRDLVCSLREKDVQAIESNIDRHFSDFEDVFKKRDSSIASEQ